jgi:hypothetical protein
MWMQMRSQRQKLRRPSQLKWMRKLRMPMRKMKMEIVESAPVRAVHTPDLKPRVHVAPAPAPISKRRKTVPLQPSLAESYHSFFHPSRESFLYEDEDQEDKDAGEGYSDEEDGYDAEEEEPHLYRTPCSGICDTDTATGVSEKQSLS